MSARPTADVAELLADRPEWFRENVRRYVVALAALEGPCDRLREGWAEVREDMVARWAERLVDAMNGADGTHLGWFTTKDAGGYVVNWRENLPDPPESGPERRATRPGVPWWAPGLSCAWEGARQWMNKNA